MPRWKPKAGVLGPYMSAEVRLERPVDPDFQPVVFGPDVRLRTFDGRTARIENVTGYPAGWVLVVAPVKALSLLAVPWREIWDGVAETIKSLKS